MVHESLETKLVWLQNELYGAIAFSVLSIFFVSLRCVAVGFVNSRRRRVKPPIREDVLLIVSLVTYQILCASAIVSSRAYIAYYSSAKERRQHISTIYKAIYSMSVAYPVACALPKISICTMYLTFFGVLKSSRWTIYVIGIFILANCIAWLIPSVVVCIPISAVWNINTRRATCIDRNALGTWISLPQILTDIALLIQPFPHIWNLHMDRAKKVGLTLTFLIASVGLVSGCLRLAFYIHKLYFVRPGVEQTTRSIAGDTIVTYVECGMYLIAACLPRMATLVHEVCDYVRKALQNAQAAQYSDEIPEVVSPKKLPVSDECPVLQVSIASCTICWNRRSREASALEV